MLRVYLNTNKTSPSNSTNTTNTTNSTNTTNVETAIVGLEAFYRNDTNEEL